MLFEKQDLTYPPSTDESHQTISVTTPDVIHAYHRVWLKFLLYPCEPLDSTTLVSIFPRNSYYQFLSVSSQKCQVIITKKMENIDPTLKQILPDIFKKEWSLPKTTHVKRNSHRNPKCVCFHHDKTIKHLFFQCTIARFTWSIFFN
jgi:hypothetical protein